MPAFDRYVGIDYSGAETPNASLKGLRVFMALGDTEATEVPPPPSPRKYWTRRGIAEWLAGRLAEDPATIVGIEHGFSFPLSYFETRLIPPDWATFLDDFHRHWPTDADHMYIDFIRDGLHGNGDARMGNTRWRRLTELRAGRAKSVFHFDVQGSVAKSTRAAIPWLRFLRQRHGERVHFWPFVGWSIPADRHAVVRPAAGLAAHQRHHIDQRHIARRRRHPRPSSAAEGYSANGLRFVLGVAAAKLLRSREVASGSGLLLADNMIFGYPAIVSRSMPADALLLADFSGISWATWGAIEAVV